MRLRNDLEQVRMLAEQSKKREIQKMKQAQVIHDVITSIFFPHVEPMRRVLEKIMKYVVLILVALHHIYINYFQYP